MPTQTRKPSMFDAPVPMRTRGAGAQVVPYQDRIPLVGYGHYAASGNFGRGEYNQAQLYEELKLETIKKLQPERTQDLMFNLSPVVRGATNAYVSRCSTRITITPDIDEIELFRPLIESHQLKSSFDQMFQSIFKRGATCYELICKEMKMKGSRKKLYVPIRFDVHDPSRFDLILTADPEVKDGQKYMLFRRGMFGHLEPVDDPTVQYVAWRPDVSWYEYDTQGNKPSGQSRLTTTTYYNVILAQTVKMVTKILSKQGTPVLPITIDYEKLFDSRGNQLFRGNIQEYVQQKSKELQAMIKGLSEDDALILTGECVLGNYMASATTQNLTGLEAYIDKQIDLMLIGMGVPPVEIGRITKTGSLNDNSSTAMQLKFGRDCRSDQELLESYLNTLLNYVYFDLNGLTHSEKIFVEFSHRNTEEEVQNADIRMKKTETFKAEGEDTKLMLENAAALQEQLGWTDKQKREWIERQMERRKQNDAFAPEYA